MDRVSFESLIIDGFFGEVTIAINGYHAIGIAHEGIYRWTNMTERSFFDVDGRGIKVIGVDLIDNM